jgi:sugar (pentulose or hexulose) kinase
VETVEPDAGRASAYAERHSIYQSLYPALQPFYRSVATM